MSKIVDIRKRPNKKGQVNQMRQQQLGSTQQTNGSNEQILAYSRGAAEQPVFTGASDNERDIHTANTLDEQNIIMQAQHRRNYGKGANAYFSTGAQGRPQYKNYGGEYPERIFDPKPPNTMVGNLVHNKGKSKNQRNITELNSNSNNNGPQTVQNVFQFNLRVNNNPSMNGAPFIVDDPRDLTIQNQSSAGSYMQMQERRPISSAHQPVNQAEAQAQQNYLQSNPVSKYSHKMRVLKKRPNSASKKLAQTAKQITSNDQVIKSWKSPSVSKTAAKGAGGHFWPVVNRTSMTSHKQRFSNMNEPSNNEKMFYSPQFAQNGLQPGQFGNTNVLPAPHTQSYQPYSKSIKVPVQYAMNVPSSKTFSASKNITHQQQNSMFFSPDLTMRITSKSKIPQENISKEDLYEQNMHTKIQFNNLKNENRKINTQLLILENQLAQKDKLFEDMYKAAFQQVILPANNGNKTGSKLLAGLPNFDAGALNTVPQKIVYASNVKGLSTQQQQAQAQQLISSYKKTIREQTREIEKRDTEIETVKRSVKLTQYNQIMVENESYKQECIRLREQLEQMIWQNQQLQQNSPQMYIENQSAEDTFKRDPPTTENNGDKVTPPGQIAIQDEESMLRQQNDMQAAIDQKDEQLMYQDKHIKGLLQMQQEQGLQIEQLENQVLKAKQQQKRAQLRMKAQHTEELDKLKMRNQISAPQQPQSPPPQQIFQAPVQIFQNSIKSVQSQSETINSVILEDLLKQRQKQKRAELRMKAAHSEQIEKLNAKIREKERATSMPAVDATTEKTQKKLAHLQAQMLDDKQKSKRAQLRMKAAHSQQVEQLQKRFSTDERVLAPASPETESVVKSQKYKIDDLELQMLKMKNQHKRAALRAKAAQGAVLDQLQKKIASVADVFKAPNQEETQKIINDQAAKIEALTDEKLKLTQNSKRLQLRMKAQHTIELDKLKANPVRPTILKQISEETDDSQAPAAPRPEESKKIEELEIKMLNIRQKNKRNELRMKARHSADLEKIAEKVESTNKKTDGAKDKVKIDDLEGKLLKAKQQSKRDKLRMQAKHSEQLQRIKSVQVSTQQAALDVVNQITSPDFSKDLESQKKKVEDLEFKLLKAKQNDKRAQLRMKATHSLQLEKLNSKVSQTAQDSDQEHLKKINQKQADEIDQLEGKVLKMIQTNKRNQLRMKSKHTMELESIQKKQQVETQLVRQSTIAKDEQAVAKAREMIQEKIKTIQKMAQEKANLSQRVNKLQKQLTLTQSQTSQGADASPAENNQLSVDDCLAYIKDLTAELKKKDGEMEKEQFKADQQIHEMEEQMGEIRTAWFVAQKKANEMERHLKQLEQKHRKNASEPVGGDTTFDRASHSNLGVTTQQTKPQVQTEGNAEALSYSNTTDANQATMKSADAANLPNSIQITSLDQPTKSEIPQAVDPLSKVAEESQDKEVSEKQDKEQAQGDHPLTIMLQRSRTFAQEEPNVDIIPETAELRKTNTTGQVEDTNPATGKRRIKPLLNINVDAIKGKKAKQDQQQTEKAAPLITVTKAEEGSSCGSQNLPAAQDIELVPLKPEAPPPFGITVVQDEQTEFDQDDRDEMEGKTVDLPKDLDESKESSSELADKVPMQGETFNPEELKELGEKPKNDTQNIVVEEMATDRSEPGYQLPEAVDAENCAPQGGAKAEKSGSVSVTVKPNQTLQSPYNFDKDRTSMQPSSANLLYDDSFGQGSPTTFGLRQRTVLPPLELLEVKAQAAKPAGIQIGELHTENSVRPGEESDIAEDVSLFVGMDEIKGSQQSLKGSQKTIEEQISEHQQDQRQDTISSNAGAQPKIAVDSKKSNQSEIEEEDF